MPTRAAGYMRYSSDEQDSSYSIELQIRGCQDTIRREGWVLDPAHMFIDRAKTATTQAGREALERLRAAATVNAFDVLVVYKFNRLGRNFLESVDLLRELETLGIRVVSATEGDSTLVRNILLSVADDFSRTLSEVVRDGMRETALAGFSTGGTPPYGYKRQEVTDPTKRDRQGQPVIKVIWVVDEADAEIIRRIFRLYLEGLGFKRIAMKLNEERIPGPRSTSWAPSAIREILHNPTYTGVRAFGRVKKVRLKTGRRSKRSRPESEWTIVPGAHTAIIESETWSQVQAALTASQRRSHASLGAVRRTRSEYVLVSLVKCGVCGGNFTVDRRHNGWGRIYEDYVCGCRKNRGKSVCANATRLSRAPFEEQILALVERRLLDPTTRMQLKTRAEALRARGLDEARRSRPTLEKDLGKLDQKISALIDRLAVLPPDATRIVGEELEKLGRERDSVRGQLRDLDGTTQLADAFLLGLEASARRLLLPTTDTARRSRVLAKATAKLQADLESSAPEAVRHHLKQMIEQVTVHGDGRVSVDGTYGPLVLEGLRQAGKAEGASQETMRTTLVPGEGIEPSWAEARGILSSLGPPSG
jgi:site-specific DNA recombinase